MKSAELPRSVPPVIRRRPPGAIGSLPGTLHPVLRRVYAARGIGNADELSLELRRLRFESH
jgi:single-stranded-DNA-specific exonuclease